MASFGAQALSGLCWAYLMSRHLAAMTGNSSISCFIKSVRPVSGNGNRDWASREGHHQRAAPVYLAANLLTGHLSAPPPGSNSDYLVILAVLPKAAAWLQIRRSGQRPAA